MTNKSLRVLMIDDSELDSLLAMRHLSQAGYAPLLRREEDEAGTRAALSEENWDVLFCDSSMPGFGAAKALDLLRTMKLDTPLIVVSGSTGQEAAAAAVRLGAVDWVSKRDMSRLVPVVEKHVHSGDMSPAIPTAPGPMALGGGALHSFNNALSVVSTYASVLLNEIPPESPIRADLEEIEKAANTAAALAAGLFPRPPLPLILDGVSVDSARTAAQDDEGPSEALALVEERTHSLPTAAGPSSSTPMPRAVQEVCDEIGAILAEVQSAMQRLPRIGAGPGDGFASTERAVKQIGALVDSLRTAV